MQHSLALTIQGSISFSAAAVDLADWRREEETAKEINTLCIYIPSMATTAEN
jgi:hypothetical protein